MTKRTWVLIRGLARESRHWMDFPSRLAEKFPEDVILTPDLPGFGQAYERSSPRKLEEITECLRQSLEMDPNDSGFHLIGLSLGGMIALDWMLRYPEEVPSSIILNSSSSNFSFPFRRVQLKALLTLIKAQLRRKKRCKEKGVLSLVSNRKEIQESYLDSWAKFQEDRPSRFLPTLNQLWAAGNFRPDFSDLIGKKILFLASRGDRLCHWTCSENLSTHLQAPIHVHPDAGHDIASDAPDWVLDQILNWLDLS